MTEELELDCFYEIQVQSGDDWHTCGMQQHINNAVAVMGNMAKTTRCAYRIVEVKRTVVIKDGERFLEVLDD